MYQPESSLSGVVVTTSAPSVKMHWYTPASDRAKVVILSSLDVCCPLGIVSVMVMLPPLTTCSPFLTHTTEGGLELPSPTHFNVESSPTDTAIRLSGMLSVSRRSVLTVSVLVVAAEKIMLHRYHKIRILSTGAYFEICSYNGCLYLYLWGAYVHGVVQKSCSAEPCIASYFNVVWTKSMYSM